MPATTKIAWCGVGVMATLAIHAVWFHSIGYAICTVGAFFVTGFLILAILDL